MPDGDEPGVEALQLRDDGLDLTLGAPAVVIARIHVFTHRSHSHWTIPAGRL
jgi:hypothetical protein